MSGFEKLERAAKSGLRKLTVYQSATGAWHAVALSTHGTTGMSVLRTPSAATDAALDEFLKKMSPPPAADGDVFG
jgi:hypothetical protein